MVEVVMAGTILFTAEGGKSPDSTWGHETGQPLACLKVAVGEVIKLGAGPS